MPRIARIKTSGGIYHIIVRGNSDMPLFQNDNDKDKYIKIIQKYKELKKFKVYAYCIMTTHAHLVIDCAGADISKIMHSINLSYAIYFNNTYGRNGHVFGDRFKSKLITNEKYLLVVSAYIHNNPKDIRKFKNKIEKYLYSSLGIYMDIFKNPGEMLDTDCILQHFGSDKNIAKEQYLKFIARYAESNDSSMSDEIEFKNEGSEYRSERTVIVRNYSPERIISFVSEFTGIPFNINIKYNRKNTELRSLCVVMMRSLCNFSLREIGAVLGNVTLSTVWQLCERGLKLINENKKYKTIISELISNSTAS